MNNLLLGNWQTTAIGFLLALVNYFVAAGMQFPSNRQEWGAALVSALLAGLGVVAKDGNVVSRGR